MGYALDASGVEEVKPPARMATTSAESRRMPAMAATMTSPRRGSK
jgi:hypothetical protein